MWKASLNRSVKELRFVLKQGPEHHGVWAFVMNKLPELRMLNQNTFFSVTEINSNFKTNSACHVVFGDVDNTMEEVSTAGLTSADFEAVLKSKVAFGLKLDRGTVASNKDRSLPVDVVEAHKTVKYLDDGF